MIHPEETILALDHARLALAGNLLDAALAHVGKALQLSPDDDEARLLEARIRLRRHEPRLALAALSEHSCEPAGDESAQPETVVLRASALAAAGRADLAVGRMRRLAERCPKDGGVLRSLAGLLVHVGETDEAAEVLKRLVELEPDDRSAARLRADLLTDSNPEAALEALGPIDAHNLAKAARLCRMCGRLRDAQTYYGELLAAEDSGIALSPAVLADAAQTSAELGQTDQAIQRMTAAVRRAGRDVITARPMLCRLGELHLHLGEIAKAGRCFWQATRLPGRTDRLFIAEGWAGLAACAEQAGRTELMQRAKQELSDITTRTERRSQLASVYPHVMGAYHARPVDAATQHSPLQRMLADAAATMSHVADRFPNRADVHFHRAVCDAGRGEAEAASAWLEMALSINPRYAAAQNLHGSLSGGDSSGLLTLGDLDAA